MSVEVGGFIRVERFLMLCDRKHYGMYVFPVLFEKVSSVGSDEQGATPHQRGFTWCSLIVLVGCSRAVLTCSCSRFSAVFGKRPRRLCHNKTAPFI